MRRITCDATPRNWARVFTVASILVHELSRYASCTNPVVWSVSPRSTLRHAGTDGRAMKVVVDQRHQRLEGAGIAGGGQQKRESAMALVF